jgi:hypothetical protein
MKLTKMPTRYLVMVLPQVFGIANALDSSWTHLEFYGDIGCNLPPVLDGSTIALGDNKHSSGCVQIPKTNTGNASGVAIANPNPCVIGIYTDNACNNMIAYAMHWDGEPTCFPLTGSPDGTYYSQISCVSPSPSASQTASQTIPAIL